MRSTEPASDAPLFFARDDPMQGHRVLIPIDRLIDRGSRDLIPSVVTRKLVNRRSVTISPSCKRLRPVLSGAEHARLPPYGGRSAARQIPTLQEGERGAEMVNELTGYHTSSGLRCLRPKLQYDTLLRTGRPHASTAPNIIHWHRWCSLPYRPWWPIARASRRWIRHQWRSEWRCSSFIIHRVPAAKNSPKAMAVSRAVRAMRSISLNWSTASLVGTNCTA